MSPHHLNGAIRAWDFVPPQPQLDDWAATARAIVADGMWCVIEACIDIAGQSWDPVLLICSPEEDAVNRELAAWIADFPAQDLRICGYTRDTLRRVERAPRAICYLAGQH